MVAQFYIGLTAVAAAFLAIYVASLFVLAQLGSEAFTPDTLHFVLRRRAVRVSLVASFLITVACLSAAIRTSFPEFDALPRDQGTGLLLTNAWPAAILGAFVLLFGAWAGLILFTLAGTLRGPGLVTKMVKEIKPEHWRDWLDFASPPDAPVDSQLLRDLATDEERRRMVAELKAFHVRQSDLQRRNEADELADPFGPLFEIAIVAVQTRRYSVINSVLAGTRRIVNRWLKVAGELGLDPYRCASALQEHLNDLVDAAASQGTVSQVEVVIITAREMAIEAAKSNQSKQVLWFCDQLAEWASRFYGTPMASATVTAIDAMGDVAIAALYDGDVDAFEQAALELARVGESVIAKRPVGQPEALLSSRRSGREKSALTAILGAMDRSTSAFTARNTKLAGDVLLLSDALYVLGRALLSAIPIDKEASETVRTLLRLYHDLGIVAGKTHDGRAVAILCHRLEELGNKINAVGQKEIADSLAFYAFEFGMLVEAEKQNLSSDIELDGENLARILTRVCSGTGEGAVRAAIGDQYLRGHTGYIPDDAQKTFLERVESTMARRFR